mgnify:CR=1 FL=1
MTRIFAALVPPQDVLAHLHVALAALPRGKDAQAALPREKDGKRGQPARPTLRWGDPAQWHMTVAFYGDIAEGAVPELTAALDESVGALEAPTLRLRGAGSFGGRNLWVGVTPEGPDDARSLSALLETSAAVGDVVGADLLEGRDRRRAHLTLARVSAGARRHGRAPEELTAVVRALAVYEGPPWRPGEVVLVSSELGAGRSGGPLHQVIATLPFAPDPAAS